MQSNIKGEEDAGSGRQSGICTANGESSRKGEETIKVGRRSFTPPPAQSLHHTTCIIPIYRDQYNPFIVPNLVIIISIITNKLDFLHMTACS